MASGSKKRSATVSSLYSARARAASPFPKKSLFTWTWRPHVLVSCERIPSARAAAHTSAHSARPSSDMSTSGLMGCVTSSTPQSSELSLLK